MHVLVTTLITKIHGIHPCKDGMAYFKTHVELNIIGGTQQSWQNDKSAFADMNLKLTSDSPLPTAFRASR